MLVVQKLTGICRRRLKTIGAVSSAAAGVIMAMMLFCPTASAATDFCVGGKLGAGSKPDPQDLVIAGEICTVDGSKGSYYFHNVYVFGKGMLVFNNATIDFYAANILVQNGGTLQATGIGAKGEKLTIHLYGNPDEAGITCKKLDGKSVVDDDTCGVPAGGSPEIADVWGSNMMDMLHPKSCTKTSQLTPPTTLPGGVNDCFYQYNKLDSKDADNMYFGHKVLALSYGGTIQMSGYKGTLGSDDGNPAVLSSSWQRLNKTLKGGGSETSLELGNAVTDWANGDDIVVTATDYLPGHAEQLKVAKATGTIIDLIGSVTNPHWGQAYSLANVPCKNEQNKNEPLTCEIGPDLLPGQTPADRNIDSRAAVGLLSRSIRIVSDGGSPGAPFTGYFGGHTLVRQGFMSYQIQGVEFYQLGQGGAIRHYPVHFHMARQSPADTYVKDSSVWDSMTRWMTIHATQGVTLARNVGYKSIGHGFYLEDGSEAGNVLNTNLGVFARAAVDNDQNDRKVPGILAEPGDYGADNPYHSDWEFPTVFWMMNGWNEFQYNYAASAGSCGVCYWLLPGGISGPSRYEYFEGYAGQQVVIPFPDQPGYILNRAGLTPLEKFVGNSCSVAMTSFLNIGQTAPCLGITNNPGLSNQLQAIPNDDAPPKGKPGDDPYYPFVTGLRNATQCTGVDCSDNVVNHPCSGFGPDEANCVVTTLERYSTSFNWAAKNFAAIWLRPWWFLMENSSITDVQQGGLTFVTSGGYTRADVAQGYWSLLRKSSLVGNTQPILTDDKGVSVPANPFASNGGPFNPKGLKECDKPLETSFCLSKAQGISYPMEFFSVNQKLFSIYDGPAFQERNAYLDVTATKIGQRKDCAVSPDGVEQTCEDFNWLYGREFGLTADTASDATNPSCYLPNAAIGWKQSNGFFYPPAFHSDKLYFNNVDIRHFVIEPLFDFGTFTTNADEIKKRYCTWKTDMFANFTDIDRQTELNDDDGSLTGLLGEPKTGVLRETISVNEDPFFNAPKVAVECASDLHPKKVPATDPPATANTSPYEYVTTATIAKCGINRAGCLQNAGPNQYFAWGGTCTAGVGPTFCYGVPLYRQYLTDAEYTEYSMNPIGYERPAIRMMGQDTGQRSTLTVNHGKYYIDDQVKLQTQIFAGAKNFNVYLPNETYYTYFLFAKPGTQQIYQMFVGYGLNKKTVEDSVKQFRVNIDVQNYVFKDASSAAKFIDAKYDDRPEKDGGTGLVTVEVNLSAYQAEFAKDTPKFCQPRTYCKPDDLDDSKCVCIPGTGCTDNAVCAWSIKDIDCPLDGCFAFGITLPPTFAAGVAKPPVPDKFVNDPMFTEHWAVPWNLVDETVSGKQCHYTTNP
ncbi:MAG: hypothetical protein ABSD20_06440 [Terriglobales bacterium]|jgi:hypothetical protein